MYIFLKKIAEKHKKWGMEAVDRIQAYEKQKKEPGCSAVRFPLVRHTGLEPVTSCTSSRRSNQLS